MCRHNSSGTPNGTCKDSSTDRTHQSTSYKLCHSPALQGCEIRSALLRSRPAHGIRALPGAHLTPRLISDHQLRHPSTHPHIPPEQIGHFLCSLPSKGTSASCQEFFSNATAAFGFTKAATLQTGLGTPGEPFPSGSGSKQDLRLHFPNYMGLHVPFACQNKHRIKPKGRVPHTLVGR